MTDPLHPQQPQEHKPLSARVPEKIARGVMANNFLSMFTPSEVVIDFLQFITRPPNLASRVIMTPQCAEQFLAVLRENLSRYSASYGPPPQIPRNPNDRQLTAQEVYDELKLTDEQLHGSYANACMVGHTPTEFSVDFITTFMPNAVVSSRIYLAAPRVPQLIENLARGLQQYRQRGQQPPQNPPKEGPNFGTAPGIPGFPTPPQN